jgi:hypothetical protein
MILDPLRKKKRSNQQKSRQRAVIRLQDLAPQREVKGGAGKLLFGEAPEPHEHTREESAPRDDAKEP